MVKSPTVQSLTGQVTLMISERIATRELLLRPRQPSQRVFEKSMVTTLASIHEAMHCLATPDGARRTAAKRA